LPFKYFAGCGVDSAGKSLLKSEPFDLGDFLMGFTSFAKHGYFSFGRVDRHCRGCGGRRDGAPSDARPDRQTGKHMGLMATLCADCHGLVDRLRHDDRITAVFIFTQRNKTKYYAAFRTSIS
jgi:hypothetical protein